MPSDAGDSFNAGFLAQNVRGADLPSCLAVGNAAGALSAARPGGTEAFTDPQYMEQFLDEHARLAPQAIK
jgi:sugar/nucleoside kinase (ribokinase family)